MFELSKTMLMFNPAHPGELIRETIDGIIEATGRKMGIKLSTGFSNTTAEFWLQIQDVYDLFQARKKVDTRNIRVFWKAAVL